MKSVKVLLENEFAVAGDDHGMNIRGVNVDDRPVDDGLDQFLQPLARDLLVLSRRDGPSVALVEIRERLPIHKEVGVAEPLHTCLQSERRSTDRVIAPHVAIHRQNTLATFGFFPDEIPPFMTRMRAVECSRTGARSRT